MNYTYDGDGNRLEKRTLSNGQCAAVTKSYWYGAGTEILDEMTGDGTFSNEYVFFGGKRIAMRNVFSGTIYYYAEDMLGSSRTIVQAGQTTPCYDGDFYPFGGERVITNTCSQNYKFEGKERDTESGSDDFGARYYSSRLGRWLSADWSSVPVPVPYANLTNPQTLNLYAMVSDNPETFADLDGHQDGGNTGCTASTVPGTVPNCQASSNAPPKPGEGPSSNNNADCKNPSATCTSTTQNALSSERSIVTASFTTAAPTTALGAVIGEAVEPAGGGVVGAAIGSEFGVGVTASYVPSTESLFAGFTANFTPVPGGGTGASVNALIVPAGQNPNSIANGPTFSATIQPMRVTGVTVTKSPGSGPAVAGPSVGTRVPVSVSASYSFNVTHIVSSMIKTITGWF